MLDLATNAPALTSPPPVGDEARLIATLPLNADGRRLKDIRLAARMSQEKFAALIGVTAMWLRMFEKGDMPLYRCRNRTLVLIAAALLRLKVRLTEEDRKSVV